MKEHWLVTAAARTLGRPAPDVVIDPDLGLEESWRASAEAFDISEQELTTLVAGAFRLPRADLSEAQPTATKLLPASVAREHMVFPIRDDDRTLVVACADPTNPDIEQAVGFVSGRTPDIRLECPSALTGGDRHRL